MKEGQSYNIKKKKRNLFLAATFCAVLSFKPSMYLQCPQGYCDEVEEETAEEADEAGTDAADASDVTVESLMNDPAVKEQYEEAFASYEEQGMTVAVEATGNELIMSLTITDSSLVQDGAAEQLETGLDALASSFETLAGSLDQAVGADAGTCTYTVRYLDTDGSVLVERSFTAKQ